MTRDHIINSLEPITTLQDWPYENQHGRLNDAAVLVPLVERDEWQVILTKRTDHLNHHPGQISFPGGRADKEDITPVDTALRETEEEIGISHNLIDLAGVIEPYVTVTHFHVVPVVGFVDPSYQVSMDTFEVAEVFEVPLSVLTNPDGYRQESIFWEGKWRKYWELNYNGYRIWGATAAMLHSLSGRLRRLD